MVSAKKIFSYSESLKQNYQTQNLENNFEPVFEQSIMPQLKLLLRDTAEEVRLAVASDLLSFSSLLDEDCFKNQILPLITDILSNESYTAIPETILHNLNQLPETIDLTQSLQSIPNIVRTLIINSECHWRTRRNLLVAFIHISKFASKEFFSENLTTNYGALLGDPVFAVRRSAVIILPLLAKRYSMDWIIDNIIPFLTMFTNHSRYLYRLIPLFGIQELICSSFIQEDNYLKDLETLVKHSNVDVSQKAVKAIALIVKLKDKIKEELESDKYKDILSLTKNIPNFKETDKIDIYVEDILGTLKQCSNCNIFSVDEQCLNKSCTYLEGLLRLIYTTCLDTVIQLFNDAIVNVQIRSLYMLNVIKDFIDNLDKGLQALWVQQVLSELSTEDIEIINDQINIILAKREVQQFKTISQTEDTAATILKLENTPKSSAPQENLEMNLREVTLTEESQINDEPEEELVIKQIAPMEFYHF